MPREPSPGRGQVGGVVREAAAATRPRPRTSSHARVVETGLGVVDRVLGVEAGAQGRAFAAGVALHQGAHHAGDVLLGTGEPALQHDEVDAQVLRGTGDELQDLRQAAQRLHLRRSAALARLLRAAQLPEKSHRALQLPAHGELAEAGQVDDLGRGHRADEGVAVRGALGERRQHLLHVRLEEQHGADDDVGAGDVRPAARQGRLVVAPVARRMHVEHEPRDRRAQTPLDARHRVAEVPVERDDDHAHRRFLSVHSAPWHRRASPG